MKVFTSFLLLLALVLPSCGDEGRSLDSYYAELAPIMRNHHDELASHRATWPGMDATRLAAAHDAYRQSLERFAAELGAIAPASGARDAHDRMTVATRALAIIYADRSAATDGESVPDLDGREERRSSEWFTACHDLQDLALVEDIDVDLLCVTMLQSNQE